MQYGDEEALGGVQGGEEVGQDERRSAQEHQARGPGDALQEEQRQGAHRPRPGNHISFSFLTTRVHSPKSVSNGIFFPVPGL